MSGFVCDLGGLGVATVVAEALRDCCMMVSFNSALISSCFRFFSFRIALA